MGGRTNTVLQSINLDGEMVCVDIFQRQDDSFGFDEYRRDPEDPRGWYSIGHFDWQVFDTEAKALDQAKRSVGWLALQL